MPDKAETQWLQRLLQSNLKRDEILLKICEHLDAENDHYDWVGFYVAESEKKELVLGPYVGAPTDHVRIPFGRGVCGQAADALETVIVPDVSGESNYLACSLAVQSEIVVPVFKNGVFVAELDIDSHQQDSFSEADREYLEQICREIAEIF